MKTLILLPLKRFTVNLPKGVWILNEVAQYVNALFGVGSKSFSIQKWTFKKEITKWLCSEVDIWKHFLLIQSFLSDEVPKYHKCCFAVPLKPVLMDAPPSSTSAVIPTRKATVPSIFQRCVLPVPVMAVHSIYYGWQSMAVLRVRLRTTKSLGGSATRMGSRKFSMCGRSQSKCGTKVKVGLV